jgi:hypothetical protein
MGLGNDHGFDCVWAVYLDRIVLHVIVERAFDVLVLVLGLILRVAKPRLRSLGTGGGGRR